MLANPVIVGSVNAARGHFQTGATVWSRHAPAIKEVVEWTTLARGG